MVEFVTLTCPSCGGTLDVTDDLDRFACAHCGTEHVVHRGGTTVSLSPVLQGLSRLQAGVDRTASELAIQRLGTEIATLDREKARLRDDLEQSGSAGWVGWILVLLGGAAVCIGIFGLSSDQWGSAVICDLIGLLLIALGYVVLKGNSLLKEKRTKKLVRAETVLKEKRAELAVHREAVGV
jgi:predicted RNA-binding Zn-ribbon protein involved in translation (DUF1610 family)